MLIALALTLGSTPAFADLESDMQTLAKNLQILQKSTSEADIKNALGEMRSSALSAQNQTPPKLEGKPIDSAEMQDYRHGFDLLITQIDDDLKLAGEGKLKDAGVLSEALITIRNEYHKKYR